MTPKEKAIELISKFNYGNKHYLMPDAKQCALITLLEIIKVVKVYNDTQAEYTYWQEVKLEIEKL